MRIDIEDFQYQAPLIPCLHRCKSCGCRLRAENSDLIVALVSQWVDGTSVDAYFCNRDCAKRYYNMIKKRERKYELTESELHDYIEK